MDVACLGIHESVSEIFPPSLLQEELESLDPDVMVVSDDDLDAVNAVVTFAYSDAFLDEVDWVHSVQAGYDRFPLEEFRERGIVLTNSSGIHGTSVGETAAGLLLMLARNLHSFVENQGSHEWDRGTWDRPFTLFDEKLCIVGLGALGQGIARRADGMGMRVVGVRRKPVRVPHVREVFTPDRLHEAISDAKFVAVTVPLTEKTKGMFGPEEFAAIRDDAYFVNVARGSVVKQDALVDALQSDELAGAGLDVFEAEPLPEDSPLWEMDDVIVTPHIAAQDRNYYQDIAALVRQNVLHLAADEEFVNRVV